MIDHFAIDVADIVRSRAFYEAALKPFGYRVLMEEKDGGASVIMFGVDAPEFVLADKSRPAEATHIAFRADTRDQVDAFHAVALAAGGRDNGGPGVRENYGPNYYAAFVFDPMCSTLKPSVTHRSRRGRSWRGIVSLCFPRAGPRCDIF